MANEFKVRKSLVVNGSGSVLLDVQGSQGQLFSITDSLSGSLFSVKDISGMPIMEVFSDDTVRLGQYAAEAIIVSGSSARMTGSLLGTASYATQALTASNANTASFVILAQTASFVQTAQTASFVQTAQTASYVLNAVSSSFAATASSADNLTVRGTLTAQTINVQTITSSIEFNTGSTRNGSTTANTHDFTGSVGMTGSLTVNNNLLVTGSVTAAGAIARGTQINSTLVAAANNDVLVGLDIAPTFTNGAFTGVGNLGLRIGGVNGLRYDVANTRLTIGALAQAAQGSIHTSGQGIFEGGLAFQYDTGASAYVSNFTYSTSGGGYLNIQSWASKPIWINNLGNNVFFGGGGSGNVVIGSNTSTGFKFEVNGTTRLNGNTTVTGSVTSTLGFTGSLQGTATTASFVQTAQTASYVLNAVSSSFALTASYISGSGGGVGFPFSGSAIITGSLLVSQSFVDFTKATYVTGSFTGSLQGTSSFALNANTASFASSASYAVFAGNAPGTTATFTQSVAATTWSFTHNLNTRNPLLQVYDSTNSQVIPFNIVGTDPNQATIYFDTAESGFAVASNGGGLTVSGSTARLDQTSAAVTWSFTHNLATKYPNFEIWDSNDDVVIPAGIHSVNDMTAEIYFAFPTTGVAIASFSGIAGSPNATTASYAVTATTASYANNFIVANTLTIDQTLTDYHVVPSSIAGSNNMFNLVTGSYSSGFFKYTVANGNNARSGEIMAVWAGGAIQFTDNSTLDIGNTSGVVASAVIVSNSVQFNLTTATSGWRLKSLATFM